MQTASERRTNGMVHTLAEASSGAAALAHRGKELNGMYPHMALKIAALTKAALKGKLPSQPVHHKNGLSTTVLQSVGAERRVAKTEAAPTPQQVPTSPHPTPLPPQSLISRHCSTLVHSRSNHLTSANLEMEKKLSSTLRKLRQKQLSLTHTHTTRQLEAFSTHSLSTSSSSSLSGSNEESENSLMSSHGLASSPLPSTSSNAGISEAATSLQQQLQCLEQFVDEDVTCSSSDDDEDDEMLDRGRERRNIAKRHWERDRTQLGAKWSWLCHQVTSLNQQIRQLNSHLHAVPAKKPVSLAQPALTTVPCLCQRHPSQSRSSNGSLLPSLQKSSSQLSKSSVNGLPTPCNCQLRQMLVANSASMPQLQVRDLLGCGFPVLLMEESTQTSARTRPLTQAPRRKLVKLSNRHRQRQQKRGGGGLDLSHHPQLSHPGDFPSSMWLDSALHQILQEHCYASLPLSKRRKAASSLTSVFSTPVNRTLLRLDRSRSFSPSPSPSETSLDRSKSAVRRQSSILADSLNDSRPATPTLPSAVRKKKGSATPSFDIDNIVIPYSMACSTRLEKLEYKEIVTPKWRKIDSTSDLSNGSGEHEVKAEGGRLRVAREPGEGHRSRVIRKLNLKEKEEVPLKDVKQPKEVQSSENDEEDYSDEAFIVRHGKCESLERKRYLNFITGNTRKRQRPSTQASTPDSVHSPVSFTGADVEPAPLPLHVQPWAPRHFPLVGKSLADLTEASPSPPKKVFKSSISINSTAFSPQDNNNSPPALVSPSYSPGAAEECPLADSSHWVVLGPPVAVSTPLLSHKPPGIVLKLTKKP